MAALFLPSTLVEKLWVSLPGRSAARTSSPPARATQRRQAWTVGAFAGVGYAMALKADIDVHDSGGAGSLALARVPAAFPAALASARPDLGAETAAAIAAGCTGARH